MMDSMNLAKTARQRRRHVALLVETSLISGREILRGISQYARSHGPWTIYHEPRSLEDASPAWLKTWRGDGVIVRLNNRRLADAVLRLKLPTVDVLGVAGDAGIPLVHVNNELIGRAAAEHLLERGLRHFAYCGTAELNWAQERRESFVKAVAAAGCECRIYRLPYAVRSDLSWETQQERLAEWIRRLPKPVGIMACFDPIGQRVLDACQRAGVASPEQAAVVGVDNDETVCEVCNPPLSSVMTNHEQVGYEAAALLDRLMHGRRPPASPIFVAPHGVATRLSSDTLAVGDRDVAAALAMIRDRACDGLSVHDVIKHVSISYSSMKERFQRILGHSIHDEIVRTQLKRAQELLDASNLPLRQVAKLAGFRHQEYMGYVFRKRLEKTPGQYRAEIGSKLSEMAKRRQK
jgi:LacI family transcriptional regulator